MLSLRKRKVETRMTIIVYDQKSLITDSLGIMVFDNTNRLSYHATKIHYNEHRTVAFAYCGKMHPSYLNDWFARHYEAELVLAELLAVEIANPQPIIRKAIRGIRNVIEGMMFSPKELAHGIGISRNQAVQFTQDGSYGIGEDLFNGSGCYTEAYWMMRQAGWTPAKAMGKIADTSPLCGGAVNIQPQAALNEPDILDYCQQIIEGSGNEDLTFSQLRLRALPVKPVKKTRKAA